MLICKLLEKSDMIKRCYRKDEEEQEGKKCEPFSFVFFFRRYL